MNIENIYKKYKYSRPILGIIQIVISPIYVPVGLMIEYKHEVKTYFKDCYSALLMRDI